MKNYIRYAILYIEALLMITQSQSFHTCQYKVTSTLGIRQ